MVQILFLESGGYPSTQGKQTSHLHSSSTVTMTRRTNLATCKKKCVLKWLAKVWSFELPVTFWFCEALFRSWLLVRLGHFIDACPFSHKIPLHLRGSLHLLRMSYLKTDQLDTSQFISLWAVGHTSIFFSRVWFPLFGSKI